ncbi:MAG TPA: polyamine aminopropyltransferase [Methylophilaceae bacterium]|jgi:spermidine synthase
MGLLRNAPRRIGRFISDHWKDGGLPAVNVVERDGVRILCLDSNSVQSSMKISDPYQLEIAYTRGMMCFMLFTKTAKNVLAIGLGGGSLPKYIHHFLPQMKTLVVELNPAVIQAARTQFLLPPDDERLTVLQENGAHYVTEHDECADVILLDAYDGKGVAPELSSQAFLDRCHSALTEHGILTINLWSSDKSYQTYLERIQTSFDGRVLVMPTGKPGNIVVFAFKGYLGDLRWSALKERAKLLGVTHTKIEFIKFLDSLRDYNLHNPTRLVV